LTTQPDDRISVVLVDDHALVRDGVCEILSAQSGIEVVGQAANSEDAIAQVVRHRPDIVLLDVELPGGEVTDTVTRMRALAPDSQIIILSMYDGPQLMRRLISGGIRGYLLKSVDRQELVAAIRSVHSSPNHMVIAVSQSSLAQMHGGGAQPVLSERELEILRLVAQALSNSQVATRLHITEPTVKRHLRNVFTKLGAVSRIDAVNKAISASLLAPETPGGPGRGDWSQRGRVR
jgi:DNA-binding NarL/FixJ family response regulator